jgi:hypothetical protein
MHGLINHKDSKTKWGYPKKLTYKGTLRQVFIRAYRMKIQSVIFLFLTQLCELLPLFLDLLPSSLCQSTGYTDSGGGGGCRVLLETIFCRSLPLCIWPDSEATKLLDYPQQKPRRGGGLRQINTCHRVPLQDDFFRWRHFALRSNLGWTIRPN